MVVIRILNAWEASCQPSLCCYSRNSSLANLVNFDAQSKSHLMESSVPDSAPCFLFLGEQDNWPLSGNFTEWGLVISCYNLKIKSANAASVNLWTSRNVVTIFCWFKSENKCIIAVHRYKLKDTAATDRKLACSNRCEVHQHNVQAFSASASGLGAHSAGGFTQMESHM